MIAFGGIAALVIGSALLLEEASPVFVPVIGMVGGIASRCGEQLKPPRILGQQGEDFGHRVERRVLPERRQGLNVARGDREAAQRQGDHYICPDADATTLAKTRCFRSVRMCSI